jgi:hypothetical protein
MCLADSYFVHRFPPLLISVAALAFPGPSSLYETLFKHSSLYVEPSDLFSYLALTLSSHISSNPVLREVFHFPLVKYHRIISHGPCNRSYKF